jgi:hypothetical protein
MYMETQCLETDKEWIHFTQTLLKEHTWEWWMSQKQKTPNLLESLTWEEFSNCSWTWGSSSITLCFRMGWNSLSSLKGTIGARWPLMSRTLVACSLQSPWKMNMLES